MTPVSIVKIVASASMLVAACSAAVVFNVKREERLETVTATTSPSQPAPSVRNEGSVAPAATEGKAIHAPLQNSADEGENSAPDSAGGNFEAENSAPDSPDETCCSPSKANDRLEQ
jgi:hypothetical protein